MASPEEVPAPCPHWPYQELQQEVEEAARLLQETGRPPRNTGKSPRQRDNMYAQNIARFIVDMSFIREAGALFPMPIGYEIERR